MWGLAEAVEGFGELEDVSAGGVDEDFFCLWKGCVYECRHYVALCGNPF